MNVLKKIMAISGILLIIFTMSSCSIKKHNVTINESTVGYSEINDESTEYSDKTSDDFETTEVSVTDKVEESTLSENVETVKVLKMISDYPMGTAGSVQKGVDTAVYLLNLTACKSAEEVGSDFETFYSSLGSKAKSNYSQNFYEIDYIARSLLSGSNEYTVYLSDSSVQFRPDDYDLETYNSIYSVICPEDCNTNI